MPYVQAGTSTTTECTGWPAGALSAVRLPPSIPSIPVRFFSRSNGEERIGRDAETEMMHARTKLEAFLDQGSGIGIGTGAAPHCVHGSCSRVPVSPLARGRSYYLRDRC
jgi:hypothetical protein